MMKNKTITILGYVLGNKTLKKIQLRAFFISIVYKI